MTSSNAPAAGGRIESDDPGPPQRPASPPPSLSHPQQAMTVVSAGANTTLHATDNLVDAPVQLSGSTHANPPRPASLEIPGSASASTAPLESSINDANAAGAMSGAVDLFQQEPQPGTVSTMAPQPLSLPMLDTALGAFGRVGDQYDHNEDYDQQMLSPPTVSPLSTPAVTHVHLDDDKDMDALMLSTPGNAPELGGGKKGLQEAAAIIPNSTSGFSLSQPAHAGTGSAAMDLDEPQLPEISAYHAQLIRQGLDPTSNRRSGPVGGAQRTLEHMQSIATTDPEPDNLQRYNPGTSGANGNVDPNVLMMALANASGAQFDHLPNAIAPSEISLHDKTSFTQEDDDPTTPSASARTNQNLESFARIEFEDSVFQMTTYAVIIGRDQKAINQARKDEKRMDMYRRRVDDAMRNGLPPPTPIAFDRGKFSKSYVSEEGGMLGPESDGEDNAKAMRKKRLGSTHASVNGDDSNDDRVKSNRQYVSHTPGAAAVDVGTLQPSTDHIPFIGIHSPGPDIAKKTKGISRQHLKIQFNAALGVFQAVALHRNGFFVGDVICKDEHPVTLRSGEKLQIKDVSFRFIINGVEEGKTGGEELDEETSSKRMSIGGKEMSFDFEHSENEKYQDSSEDLSPSAEADRSPTPPPPSVPSPVVPRIPLPVVTPAPVMLPTTELPVAVVYPREPSPAPISEPDPMHYGLSQEELALSQLQEAVSRASPSDPPPLPMPAAPPEIPVEQLQQQQHQHQIHHQQQPQIFQQPPLVPMEDMRMIDASTLGLGDEFPPEFLMQIPKRRGPGRPPKDGIMSKRERRLLKKQLQENSRKTLPQEPQGEKIKRPVGRPRKNPLPEDGEKTEKRKYNKRKSIEDGDLGSDAERRARDKKDKKVRPKSPPLQLNREDFTEEQLAKPSKNYGVLIDEALAHGPPEGLTLKQIYKRITQRYPWFYFHAETKGWESSVRHNLIGNEAFKKAETTGLWSRVPGVELDAGKKRKAVSPDRHMGGPHSHLAHMTAQHQYYQGGPYMSQSMPYGHNIQNAYAGASQAQQPGQSGHNAQVHSQQQNLGQPGYPSQAPAPAQLPPGYGVPATARPPAAAGQQSTYSSPYARPPPPPPPTQENAVKPEPGIVTSTPVPQQATAPSGPASAPEASGAQQAQITSAAQPQGYTPRATTTQNVLSVPTATMPARPYLTAEMERAIAQFRTNVMADLSKHTNKAGQIIDAAIGRLRGQSTPPTVPGFEEVEKTLVNGLQTMISKMQKVEIRSSTPATASPAPAQPPSQKPPVSVQAQPQAQRPLQPAAGVATLPSAVTVPATAQLAIPAQPSTNPPASHQTAAQNTATPQATTQVPQPHIGQSQVSHAAVQPQPHVSPAVSSTQPMVAARAPIQLPAPAQTLTQASAQPALPPQTPGLGHVPGQARPQATSQAPTAPVQQPAPVRATQGPAPSKPPVPAAGPPAVAGSACDAEIQRRIKSFRESIIGTLKAKTNQAEAIVDSAIRRAQGLPNPGAFKGWEQADRLMYESVTKIINDVRKRQDLAAQAANANASARSSQTPAPTVTAHKGPSASPAPGTPAVASPAIQTSNLARVSQPPASSPASNLTTTPSIKAVTPHAPRPGVSITSTTSPQVQRSSTTVSDAPPPARRESTSGTTPASLSTGAQPLKAPSPALAAAGVVKQSTVAAAPKPAVPNYQASAPAVKQSFQNLSAKSNLAAQTNAVRQTFTGAVNPSAGVMDQIAAQKSRMSTPGIVGQPPNHVSTGAAVTGPVASVPAAGKPSVTTPNFSAAARPSAGVVSQITGHQQRNASDSSNSKFPSPAPPSAGVLDQISSQHLRLASQQPAKPAAPGALRPAQSTPSPAPMQPAMSQTAAPKPPVPGQAAPHNTSSAPNQAASQSISPRTPAAQTVPPIAPMPQVAAPHLPANQPSAAPRPTALGPIPQPPAAQQPVAQASSPKPTSAPPPGDATAASSTSASVVKAPGLTVSPAPNSGPGPSSAASVAAPQPAITPAPVSQFPSAKPAAPSPDAVRPHAAPQLAGQKRPLEHDTKVQEEPQLKKIAVSAE